MHRRSLLDYIAENGATSDPDTAGADAAAELELRLAELEARFAAAMREEDAGEDRTFSAQIEAILKRRRAAAEQARVAGGRPVQRERISVDAPPLVPDLPVGSSDENDDFSKFVQAVQMLGRVADRFQQTPVASRPAPARRELVKESDETIRLTLALKESLAAFQALAGELAETVGQLRQPPQPDHGAAPARFRSRPRDDEEDDLRHLQDDLDDLRERLGWIARRRSGSRY